jgi:four helix bundle protein
MATFQRFEDVESWRKARCLTHAIYAITRTGGFERDFALRDQIRRACVSIMSNIAEGFDRGGNREFIQFLSVARGSAAEVRSQLYVALDAGYINQDRFGALRDQSEDVARLMGGLIRYLQASSFKGHKYRRQTGNPEP